MAVKLNLLHGRGLDRLAKQSGYSSYLRRAIELLGDEDLCALVPARPVHDHRGRALSPERPFIRGTAQNPDVYFQARETVNPFYARVTVAVAGQMDALAQIVLCDLCA